MEDLNLLLIQTDIQWQNVTANLANFEEIIWSAKSDPDIILLPELFSTGFTMNTSEYAELMNMTTFKWMKQISKARDSLVVGSYIVSDGGKTYNRSLCMEPNGTYHTYDKKHLFAFAGEDEAFDAGSERLVFEFRGWRICPLICYDLRFPVWSRNRFVNEELEYDLLLFSANWPDPRIFAWDTLLKARAIENLSYCAGVSRIGSDADGRDYPGHSAVLDFQGKEIAKLDSEDGLIECSISKGKLKEFREYFPAHKDSDHFTLEQ